MCQQQINREKRIGCIPGDGQVFDRESQKFKMDSCFFKYPAIFIYDLHMSVMKVPAVQSVC